VGLAEIGIFLIGCGVGGLWVLAYVWSSIPPRKVEPPPHPHQPISDASPGPEGEEIPPLRAPDLP
jgi:hypothetical protein